MRRSLRSGVVTLTNIKTVTDRKGRPRHYLQVKGHKLIPLPDAPMDSPDFLAAWSAAMKHAKGVETRTGTGGIATLCAAFLRSTAFKQHSVSYQAVLRRHLNAVREKMGKALARDLLPKHISFDMADLTPAVARSRLKAWRALARHGLETGELTTDPTETVKRPAVVKGDGHPVWTREEVQAFRARWPIGTTQRAIFELLFWTGARISDAVGLGAGMVNREGVLVYRQQKTKGLAYVPWSCSLPAYADTADRDAMLAALDPLKGHMTFLATRAGRTRSGKSIGGDLSASARKAGVMKSAHGLRKARATVNAEGGATAHQIGAWTGHESLSEVEHYTRAVDRMRAVIGTERDGNVGTHSVPVGKHAEM
jgi:integrase/recombinase XerD